MLGGGAFYDGLFCVEVDCVELLSFGACCLLLGDAFCVDTIAVVCDVFGGSMNEGVGCDSGVCAGLLEKVACCFDDAC